VEEEEEMRLCCIFVRNPDGEIWLEEAWDDDSIHADREGWKEAVQKTRDACRKSENEGYEYRVAWVAVAGIEHLFDPAMLLGEVWPA
jgi:hypothetical protein